jgi:hypothetical protein
MGRHRITLTVAALLLASLVLPAAAGAHALPTVSHASARTERLSLQAADAYWLQRGRTGCAQPQIQYAALSQGASGDAFIGPNLPAAYCVIRVSTHLNWRGRAGAIDYCWTIVHERGHQTGLKHSSAGIMRSDGGDKPPSACTRLFSS